MFEIFLDIREQEEIITAYQKHVKHHEKWIISVVYG